MDTVEVSERPHLKLMESLKGKRIKRLKDSFHIRPYVPAGECHRSCKYSANIVTVSWCSFTIFFSTHLCSLVNKTYNWLLVSLWTIFTKKRYMLEKCILHWKVIDWLHSIDFWLTPFSRGEGAKRWFYLHIKNHALPFRPTTHWWNNNEGTIVQLADWSRPNPSIKYVFPPLSEEALSPHWIGEEAPRPIKISMAPLRTMHIARLNLINILNTRPEPSPLCSHKLFLFAIKQSFAKSCESRLGRSSR